MLKKKERITGKIKEIDASGIGVLYQGKDKILIRNVLVQEVVICEIEKRIQEGYVAKLVKVIIPSNQRVNAKCQYYDHCGSCQLQHVAYEAQLMMKKQLVIDMLKQQKLQNIHVHECIGMEHPYAYRNKIIISFGKHKKEMIAGFYGEFSHHIIPVKNCLLHEDYTNQFIEDIKLLVKRCRIEIYDEDKRSGFLRHILIRRAVKTNQTLLVLVGAERVFKAKNNFMKELRKMHPEVQTVIFNYNPRSTSVVLGNNEQILFGKGYIEDILCDKRFRISSRSFYQINHEQCEKLYEKALSLLSLKGNETLIDAYCGIGTIGLIASDRVKQVYGVELNKDAVKDAVVNAKLNATANVKFQCADAGKFMVELAKAKSSVDVLIMDPARDGSDEQFLSSVVKLKPQQVVYISCNPKTQIRDLKYLCKHGYECRDMFLYDLFPNTFHVESICLMTQNK